MRPANGANSHEWVYLGHRYLYLVIVNGERMMSENPNLKDKGELHHEGMLHEYVCEACGRRCYSQEPITEENFADFPEPCLALN